MHGTIRIIRDVLLRTFVIGAVFTLLMAGIYYGGRAYWERLLVGRWELADQKSLNAIIVGFFAAIRFYLVFVVLTPALALHWTLKRLKE